MKLLPNKTDKVAFNYIYLGGVYDKVWSDKGTFSHNLCGYRRLIFSIEVNHKDKKLTVNNKVYNLHIGHYGFVYKKTRGNNILCSSVDDLQRHLMDVCDKENIFHRVSLSLLQKLSA